MIFPTTGEIAIIFTFLLSIYTAFLRMENKKKVNIEDFNEVMADITKFIDSYYASEEPTKEVTNEK